MQNPTSQVPQVGVQSPDEVKQLVNKLPENKMKKYALPTVLAILVIFAGIGTGWVLAGSGEDSSQAPTVAGTETSNQKEAGFNNGDLAKEPDAQGMLKEGGIDGEGTHHLDRNQGPEKNVYLTSTVIDLDSFIGKEIQVWGETSAGHTAGWLMDVVRVKVVE